VLDSVSKLLAGGDVRKEMLAAMGSVSGEIRWWVFRSLSGPESPELNRFLEVALGTNDPVIRLMALRRIEETSSGAELRDVLDSLRGEPSGQVRKEVLAAWVRSFPALRSRCSRKPCWIPAPLFVKMPGTGFGKHAQWTSLSSIAAGCKPRAPVCCRQQSQGWARLAGRRTPSHLHRISRTHEHTYGASR